MTNNLKIEVSVSDIPEDGSIASQFPSREYVDQRLAKKANLSDEGRLDPKQAPDYTEIPGLFEHIEDTKEVIGVSIAESLQDAKGYTNQQLSTSLRNKADLVNGKIPFDQIPFSADIEDQIQINVENITAVVDQKIALVVEQVNEVADATNAYTDSKVAENTNFVKSTIGNVMEDVTSTMGKVSVKKELIVPTYLTPETGVDVVNGVTDGAYFNVLSEDDNTIAIEYQNIGGVPIPSGKEYPTSNHNSMANRDVAGAHPASAILDASNETQQQVNYNGGSKWYSRNGGYLQNERVVLNNGDIVKNAVDGNENDPNVNMTGWAYSSLTPSNNLSDVADKAEARTNLGVYSKAETNSIATTPDATETVAGKAKIATTAIAQAGVNDTDFITALKLANTRRSVWVNKTGMLFGTTYMNTALYEKEISFLSAIVSGLVLTAKVTFKNLTTNIETIVYFGAVSNWTGGIASSANFTVPPNTSFKIEIVRTDSLSTVVTLAVNQWSEKYYV